MFFIKAILKKVAILLVLAVFVFFLSNSGYINADESTYIQTNLPKNNISDSQVTTAIGNITTNAKACILIEAKTGKILYAKNADTKLPMASTTKIMTTLLALESGNLDDEFVVDSEAIRVEGSTMGLVEGDVVTKRALCYGMMLPSGNDSANATAVKIGGNLENFSKLMNKRATEIGMLHSYFVTPSGLDAENHGSTAYDMALLTRTAIQNPDFLEICSSKTAKVSFGNPPFQRNLTNTNKLLTNYGGIIGVKTGFTDAAGRCLVSACERNGITIICVTLNDPDDWRDHAALYDAGFKMLKNTSIAPPEMKIDVVGGKSDQLELYVTENIAVGTLPNNTNNVKFKIITPPFVYYPQNSGEQVGFLEYYWDDLLIGKTPLYVKI